jgi:hypothetical protein
MAEKRKLADILLGSERERLTKAWDTTAKADDLTPVPPGDYRCRVLRGELFNARSGTPGYKVNFEIIEGDHAGRRLWHDLWLSDAALPMTKRDLGKLGVDRIEQLERPLPDGIVTNVRAALRKGDDGTEHNRVVRFDVLAFEPSQPDPFAPDAGEPAADDADHRDAGGFDWRKGEQEGEAAA